MATMNPFESPNPFEQVSRFDPHPLPGMIERGYAAEPLGLAALRLQFDASYAQSLTTLIESEIIPRLMVAHGAGSPQTMSAGRDALLCTDDVEAFAPLVMQVEADALIAHVETILARGVDFETVLVELLAPTARLLGTFWEEDLCDFVDVTMGLWRLQEVVQEIAGRTPAERPPAAGDRRALFASMPGDQHTFGIVMIDETFRREGWQTDRLCEAETADLLARVERDWFDLIGLTVSCDCHMARVPSTIAALRKASRNPRVCVMVGGRMFSADPDLAAHVGADGTARDARYAPKVASELVREREWAAAP